MKNANENYQQQNQASEFPFMELTEDQLTMVHGGVGPLGGLVGSTPGSDSAASSPDASSKIDLLKSLPIVGGLLGGAK
jgi:hypothetical protein